jgi:hypothetical protein
MARERLRNNNSVVALRHNNRRYFCVELPRTLTFAHAAFTLIISEPKVSPKVKHKWARVS